MKRFIFIMCFAYLAINLQAQPYILSIGKIGANPGDDVLVPVEVSGFNNLAAIGFYIIWDTTVLKFDTLKNINPLLKADLSYNMVLDTFKVVWMNWGATGIDIGEAKLFDMKFKYLGGETAIKIDSTKSMVADSDYETLNVIYNTGKVDDVNVGIMDSQYDMTYNIYPNPSDGKFNIINDSRYPIKEISIFNLNGQEILRQMINDNTKSIIPVNLKATSSNIYLLRILTNERAIYKKIILN
ncbi:MAG: T9SS type A sorting domain-containing protein [Bacteroidales bacterium]|nr:T9SS type A sorting domain-containing protein [Bacteroidales bacterium]